MHSAPRQACSTIVSANPTVCNPGLQYWHVVVAKSKPSAQLRMMCRVKGHFYDLDVVGEIELPNGDVQCTVWYVTRLYAPAHESGMCTPKLRQCQHAKAYM